MFGLCRVLIEATADPHDLRTTAINHCNVSIHLVIPRSSQEQRSIYRWSSSEDGVACRAIRATQFQLTVASPILRFLQGLGRKKRDGPDLPSCVSCGRALAARGWETASRNTWSEPLAVRVRLLDKVSDRGSNSAFLGIPRNQQV